jgi:hypothetical protein
MNAYPGKCQGVCDRCLKPQQPNCHLCSAFIILYRHGQPSSELPLLWAGMLPWHEIQTHEADMIPVPCYLHTRRTTPFQITVSFAMLRNQATEFLKEFAQNDTKNYTAPGAISEPGTDFH